MSNINRRKFMQLTGGAVAAAGAVSFSGFAIGGAMKKVVIVGGGTAGATAAKYIRMADSNIDVTVIEPNQHYYTCYMSNEVIGGDRKLETIKFSYDGLKGHGVKVVHDMVTGIDANARTVSTKGGQKFSYDRCIVAPGIDFKYETIEGYDETVAEKIPHAWKAGDQTKLLRNQLTAMKDGGTVIVAPPPNPFRCPPGPYERVCQIAHYLKHNKPKSKILVLDAKDAFSKQGLFTAGWKKHYGYGTDNSLIEWVNAAGGGKVSGVDAGSMTVTGEVEDFEGDVINVIPAQKAGKIAATAGLTDASGWCPIEGKTFESTIHKNIHVVGDAAVASPLPKSGYAANSEAKVCAAAVVALLNGKPAPHPSYVNTCYSIIAPDDGISVAMVYKYADGKISGVEGAGGLTPGYDKTTDEMRAREVGYAYSWYDNITRDIFG